MLPFLHLLALLLPLCPARAARGEDLGEGPVTVCREGCCLSWRVLQRHARPSLAPGGRGTQAAAGQETGAHGPPAATRARQGIAAQRYDEVTVEFKACAAAASLALRLPERQQCEGAGEAAKCTGYAFRQTSDGGCFLRRSRLQVLPSNSSEKARDVANAGHVASCTVDNAVGDGAPAAATAKRATALLSLQSSEEGRQPGWEFFTIEVSNPPLTPTGKDLMGSPANAFQLSLKGEDGADLGSASFEAHEIRSAWFCSYSSWYLTAPCTVRCGGGVRYRVRRLLHPPPQDYDPEMLVGCDEPLSQTVPCNEMPCDTDCQLGDWVRWADGPCTASCGTGWEVQRRRVLEAPAGSGKLCAHWSSPERVRYKPCNVHACPPRCQPLPMGHGNGSLRVVTACSEACGGGTRATLKPAWRKDLGVPEAKCAEVQSEACNAEPCKAFHLSHGKQGLLPQQLLKGLLPQRPPAWAGAWYDLQMTFFLSDMAEVLELRPPRGYQLGEFNCHLIEHNLPRLRSCLVMPAGTDQDVAKLEFHNPLEAYRGNQGNVMYKLRLWVKHPQDCPGGVDPSGICQGLEGDRTWSLHISTALPAAAEESITASYELYKAGPASAGEEDAAAGYRAYSPASTEPAAEAGEYEYKNGAVPPRETASYDAESLGQTRREGAGSSLNAAPAMKSLLEVDTFSVTDKGQFKRVKGQRPASAAHGAFHRARR